MQTFETVTVVSGAGCLDHPGMAFGMDKTAIPKGSHEGRQRFSDDMAQVAIPLDLGVAVLAKAVWTVGLLGPPSAKS